MDVYKEKISGAKDDRPERKKVLALAQGRKIDVVLCTELTRWGRSTLDLISTLRELHQRGVSLVAQTGLQCDLDTPQGKLFMTILAGLAEFERDLTIERTRSGLAAAKDRGKRLGRVPGQQLARVKAVEADVLAQVASGTSYRKVASNLGIHKDTVGQIVKRSQQVDGAVKTTAPSL